MRNAACDSASASALLQRLSETMSNAVLTPDTVHRASSAVCSVPLQSAGHSLQAPTTTTKRARSAFLSRPTTDAICPLVPVAKCATFHIALNDILLVALFVGIKVWCRQAAPQQAYKTGHGLANHHHQCHHHTSRQQHIARLVKLRA